MNRRLVRVRALAVDLARAESRADLTADVDQAPAAVRHRTMTELAVMGA
jgi:hypothetical protein